MTRRRMGTYLPTSRVKALGHFVDSDMTAYELGELMWPGHKMSKVNAGAIVRELLLGEYIHAVKAPSVPGDEHIKYRAAPKAAAVIENPPWLCKYCSTDISNSMKRLWHHHCVGCVDQHQACRSCRKQLLLATGEFPYKFKLRGCPGTVQIQKKTEKPKKKKVEEPAREMQQDLALER